MFFCSLRTSCYVEVSPKLSCLANGGKIIIFYALRARPVIEISIGRKFAITRRQQQVVNGATVDATWACNTIITRHSLRDMCGCIHFISDRNYYCHHRYRNGALNISHLAPATIHP